MADALISPQVGGAFWLASGALIAYSARKITAENDHAKIPLMGILGAFVFAAQMINFAIPGTGSSGHLGGAILLSALLGPYRALITIASVLTIQCLFFADGGILALGCNIFNLGFLPAFIAYPFIFKPLLGNTFTTKRLGGASIAAGLLGLLMGAAVVVVQTVFSGISELPFKTFVLFMLPIHCGIGIVEGLVTFGVLAFVFKTEPALLRPIAPQSSKSRIVLIVFAGATLLVGGVISWYASSHPDGLEWSMAKVTGHEVFKRMGEPVHQRLESIQKKLAFLPDYSFKTQADSAKQPANSGTSVSGIAGAVSVLMVAVVAGLLLRRKKSTVKPLP